MVPTKIGEPSCGRPGSPAGSDICRDCGLCCDGTLFDEVALLPEEIEAAASNGLQPKVEPDRVVFQQPCPRFNRICEIYANRPHQCRKYRCVLLARLEQGEVNYETAHATVLEARRLAAAVDAVMSPQEDRRGSRLRWERAFKAMTNVRAGGSAATDAEPRWLVAMTALNYYLDRHFRKPRQHRLLSAAKSQMMDSED